jgi:hypothetical protein
MSRYFNKPGPPPDIKVFILNGEGEYLAGDARDWFFTQDRSRAAIFSYQADRVPEQLEVIRKAEGIHLEPEPVPLNEIYEMCDRCKDLFMPFMTFFDGKSFLCEDCRRHASPRAPRARRA